MQVSGPYLTSNYSQCWTQDESFIITPHGWLWCIAESLLYPLGIKDREAAVLSFCVWTKKPKQSGAPIPFTQPWTCYTAPQHLTYEFQSQLPNLGLLTQPLDTSLPMSSNPSYPTLDLLHGPSTPHLLWIPLSKEHLWTTFNVTGKEPEDEEDWNHNACTVMTSDLRHFCEHLSKY